MISVNMDSGAVTVIPPRYRKRLPSVKAIYDKYYGEGGIFEMRKKQKQANAKAVDSRIEAKVSEVKTGESRNSLMLKAKDLGIKNFRVLNKEELMHVTADGITQQEIDALVDGAVTRWKSGWGKKEQHAAGRDHKE